MKPSARSLEKARDVLNAAVDDWASVPDAAGSTFKRAVVTLAISLDAARDSALEEAEELCLKGQQFLKPCCLYECSENARVIRVLRSKSGTQDRGAG